MTLDSEELRPTLAETREALRKDIEDLCRPFVIESGKQQLIDRSNQALKKIDLTISYDVLLGTFGPIPKLLAYAKRKDCRFRVTYTLPDITEGMDESDVIVTIAPVLQRASCKAG